MAGLLGEVKAACAQVAASARWVSIDEDRLTDRASRLGLEDLSVDLDPAYAYRGEPADTLAWVLTFTAVNFGSGWHRHLRKLPGRSGSITMMRRLRDRFAANGLLPPAELAEVTPEGCAELFGQDMVPPVDELMVMFAQALNDLGRLIIERYDDSFINLVEAADTRPSGWPNRCWPCPSSMTSTTTTVGGSRSSNEPRSPPPT